jgi:two-component system invasion response regulator UvrY
MPVMEAPTDPRPSAAPRATPGARVGVLVVDDQAVFRDAARELIDATPDFVLLDEASSGEHALALADCVEPDLVLVDVWMRGMDGLATAERMHAAHPSTVVVLISVADRCDLPAGVASCGAAEVLRKQDLSPALLRRVWATHRGDP